MSSLALLNPVIKNGDRSAFIQWSTVPNATGYEVNIKAESDWLPIKNRTNTTCFLTEDLTNEKNYMVEVIAMNKSTTIEKSKKIKIKPRVNLSIFDFSAKRSWHDGQIRLKWTPIPTNAGYQIERCDIGCANKYISVANITDNKISNFEDGTPCDPTKLSCAGHTYKISASDATWICGGSKSSAVVFCMKQLTLNSPTLPSMAKRSIVKCSARSATTASLSSSPPPPPSSSPPAQPAPPPSSAAAAANTAHKKSGILDTLFNKILGTTESTIKSTTSTDSNSQTNAVPIDSNNTLPQPINKSPATAGTSPSIKICKGDLITQQTDVIVVCSSSQYLFNAICKGGGDSMKTSFDAESKKNPGASLVAVKAEGQLASKKVYFLPWKMNPDASLLCQSIKKFVSDAIEKAVEEKYQSIAFPAIGCGQYGCSVSLVAQAMVDEAHVKLQKHGVSVSFVIQPDKTDIYDAFQKQISLTQQPPQVPTPVKTVSATVNKGIIEVEKGDLTTQKVDVIIGSSSSNFLKEAIIAVAGDAVKTAYDTEYKNNPNAILISTPPGNLPCRRIFFVKWQPDQDVGILRQSLIDLMWAVIQNLISHNYTSLAFPSIGCGKHGCSVDVVVKTMVKEMKNQLTMRNLPLTVKFVIQPDQQNVYDEFCKQVLMTQDDPLQSNNYQLPTTWEKSEGKKMRFELSSTSDEYKSILTNFDQAMKGKYTQFIRIERIQNERWYIQYLAHRHNFKTRLNTDTEKCLYHGCPEQATNLIMEDCFNRSFAGVNGTLYGVGVYFSSNAAYSHTYAHPNTNGERNMFIARVLIGNTTKGNGSMKTRPIGFDSTTDGNHIFVTYHDAQAYAEYLITYK